MKANTKKKLQKKGALFISIRMWGHLIETD